MPHRGSGSRALVQLPSLYPRRGGGTWVYQSPRILFMLAYLAAKGYSRQEIARALQQHLGYVTNKLRYSPEKQWLISDERLESLGYRPKSTAKPAEEAVDGNRITYFIEKLSIDMNLLETTLDTVLEVLGARSPLDVTLLPPLLTLPEKTLLLHGLSKSQAFNLHKSLQAVAYVWRGLKARDVLGVSKDTANMEFRLRWCYLSALHLATGPRRRARLTGVGYAVAQHEDDDPLKIYLDYLRDTTRLGHLIALDVVALETLTGDRFTALQEAYSMLLKWQGLEGYLDQFEAQVRGVVIVQPSDVPGRTMVTLAKTIDQLVWELEV
ncbi:hypothetical protein [Pyrodictium abyssi]|uniref:Uncharacterized protein n=1 Tax=Pyrodictium abyssi TaxID=54256 RepID=A0ABM8IYH3_9CREN|nr:hypothetical protein PABY_12570 [Pyrodictium abyssi]